MELVKELAGRQFNDETKQFFYNNYIKYTYDENRIILSSATKNPDFKWPCANGLVLSLSDNWKILSCPPRLSLEVLPRDISDYDIYSAEDGTVITFYQYEGRWLMSSVRGIDVGPIVWDDSVSFEDAFYQSLQMDKDEFISLLDQNKNMNYSFGFTHPLIHPFVSNKMNVWFIQAYNLADNQVPHQTQFDHMKQTKIIGLNRNTIINRCDSSITDFEEKKIVCHGYVLRSKTHNKSIYVESKLHRIIAEIYYDHDYVLECKKYGTTRVNYMLVSVFANRNDTIFRTIFPNLPYLNKFDEFNKKLSIAIDIIRDHIFKGVECTQIYKELIEAIQRHITIKVSDKDYEVNMKSAILTPSNIPVLLRLLL